MTKPVKPELSLLGIYAHPDDEAFGAGGALARYAARGARVQLVCATRGEAGKLTDPELGEVKDIAALRQAELERACEILGLLPPIFLGYHDSGRGDRLRRDDERALINADPERLERELLRHIKEAKPQVMLTFDPHGIYGHPDHLVIHRAATAAFWSAGGVMQPAPRRLFYNVLKAETMRAMQAQRGPSPLSDLDPDLYGVSADSLAAVLEVDEVLEQKGAAIRAHRSQVGPQSSFAGMPGELWTEMLRLETFSLGGLRGGFPEGPVDDLFVGL
ncbi:MAG: PIG-L family deacetylase [Deinococcota bacterium]|jgi:N-acetyl-1-D-myo-inositol-2-amino-2-deoxy-alpha-D-glucopyranoside deacetylase|nr:PIG-L family deacetylase [Deinococcota bacterium]